MLLTVIYSVAVCRCTVLDLCSMLRLSTNDDAVCVDAPIEINVLNYN